MPTARAPTPGATSTRGLADRVLIVAPELRVIIERRRTRDPETLARRYFGDADIVLVEGFKQAPIPRVEVYRTESAPAPAVRRGGSQRRAVGGDHRDRRSGAARQVSGAAVLRHDVAPLAHVAGLGARQGPRRVNARLAAGRPRADPRRGRRPTRPPRAARRRLGSVLAEAVISPLNIPPGPIRRWMATPPAPTTCAARAPRAGQTPSDRADRGGQRSRARHRRANAPGSSPAPHCPTAPIP